MNAKEQLKEIILENNYFDTLPGLRFKEWNNIMMFTAVISFAGRSRRRESYELLNSASDSDVVYVTHLVLDRTGNIWAAIGPEDTDDFGEILHPNLENVDSFDEDVLEEWVELLTF